MSNKEELNYIKGVRITINPKDYPSMSKPLFLDICKLVSYVASEYDRHYVEVFRKHEIEQYLKNKKE